MSSEATPRPWSAGGDATVNGNYKYVEILRLVERGERGLDVRVGSMTIATSGTGTTAPIPESVGRANIDFMLRAVNAHDALIAACDVSLGFIDEIERGSNPQYLAGGVRAAIQAALALARGGETEG